MKKKFIVLGLSLLLILIGVWFIRPLIFAQKQGEDVGQIAKAIVQIHLTGKDIVPLDTKGMYLEKVGLEGDKEPSFVAYFIKQGYSVDSISVCDRAYCIYKEGEEKKVFTSDQCSALYLIWKRVK